MQLSRNVSASLLLALLSAVLIAQYFLIDSSSQFARALSLLLILMLVGIYAHQRVTSARLAERLDEAKSSVQTMLDGISDPTLIVDKDYQVTAMNEAARAALPEGITSGEFVPCYRALHGLEEPCDPATHPCTLMTGQSGKRLQLVPGPDGQHRMLEFRSTPLRDRAGNLTGAIEIAHDLNEQEESALNIEQGRRNAAAANQARREFSATMSHEVRTPLNAVLGMVDLLRFSDLKRKQEAYVQVIENSGNMLLSLVDNMLDYSTLESGQLRLDEQDFRAADLLEQVLKIMGYPAYSKGLELMADTSSDLGQTLSADMNRLRQIMVNVISNAIKFTNVGEVIIRIDVNVEDTEQAKLVLEVEDSGVGMSDATLATLFHPYKPASGAAGEVRNKGSGLGLTISKQLVDLMNGELTVTSTLGQGTVARISVPVGLIADDRPESTHRGQALRSRRMLVVGDNDKLVNVICRTLGNWGMRCDSIANPDHAIDLLAAAKAGSEPYDGAVIDFDLPDGDGIAAARMIRSNPALAYLPIVMLASIVRPLEVGKISSIGGIRCVNKPILPSELRHNLFSVLEVDEWQGRQNEEEDLPKLRVLIAEDNPLNMKLLSRMLNSLGHEVDCAENGPAALSAFEADGYDLILMDCQMPGLDGDEVTRRIRSNTHKHARQPIIVAVTADVSAEHKSKCLEAGMDDFLPKPVRLQALKSALRRWSTLFAGTNQPLLAGDSVTAPAEDEEITARLQDRAGGSGAAFVNDFINLFLDDTATRLQIMRAAIEHDDQATLGRECHALKGACLELGVTKMGQCCDALKKAGEEKKSRRDTTAALDRLWKEFERVKSLLDAKKVRQA